MGERRIKSQIYSKSQKKSSGLNKQPDFQNQKAVLEKLEDGQYYWILYVNGERIGPVEKATEEELSCWDPNQADGIDHSREVKG